MHRGARARQFTEPRPWMRKTMPEIEKQLAVSDIAEILANRHKLGDYEEVLRRLRYFTAEGLLETAARSIRGRDEGGSTHLRR
jgi:hypothetical protein